MILSVITIYSGFCETEEMLIPKTIGKIIKGFRSILRMDRLLPIGHRYHIYDFEEE